VRVGRFHDIPDVTPGLVRVDDSGVFQSDTLDQREETVVERQQNPVVLDRVREVLSSGPYPLCSYATVTSFTRMPVPSMVGAPSLCSGSRTMLMDSSSRPVGDKKNVVGNKLTGADVFCGQNRIHAGTQSSVKMYGLGTHTVSQY
jgi:hypothetical protein